MQVCTFMGMTPSDWAAWVGAVGTGAAAWLAVSLYSRSRRDAQADAMAKRKVLHYVLREYVRNASKFVKDAERWLETKSVRALKRRYLMRLLRMAAADRLIDLQSRLMEFGEEGDAEIAAFIEGCRHYQATHLFYDERVQEEHFWEDTDDEDVAAPFIILRGEIDRLSARLEPALAAIERFERR